MRYLQAKALGGYIRQGNEEPTRTLLEMAAAKLEESIYFLEPEMAVRPPPKFRSSYAAYGIAMALGLGMSPAVLGGLLGAASVGSTVFDL